jgi:hypothetical protein
MDELLKYQKAALVNGLCGKYKGYWQAAANDKEKLVRLALQQQSIPHLLTYCHNGQGLSKEYIQDKFKDYINGNYIAIDVDGVEGQYKTELYVGFDGILTLCDDVFCSMWTTIPYLTLPTCKATKIYCGCSSKLNINCDGFNSVIIMLFDDSEISIEDADETCAFTIYKYSDKCKVNYGKYCLSKRIKEFNKELRL